MMFNWLKRKWKSLWEYHPNEIWVVMPGDNDGEVRLRRLKRETDKELMEIIEEEQC